MTPLIVFRSVLFCLVFALGWLSAQDSDRVFFPGQTSAGGNRGRTPPVSRGTNTAARSGGDSPVIQFHKINDNNRIKVSSGKSLPKPTPCSNGQDFCGGDEQLYPKDQVNRILKNTLSLQYSSAATDQFFKAPEETGQNLQELGNRFADLSDEGPMTACYSVPETIPVLARALNLRRQWKYLAQLSNNKVQHHTIVKCLNPAAKCINDADSPQKNTTVCRQVYKTARMLAFDENGEMEVDSFRLPSACVCHFTRNQFVVRSGNLQSQSTEKCEAPTEKLDKQDLEFLRNNQHRRPPGKRAGRQFDDNSRTIPVEDDASFVARCEDGEVMCDTDDGFYPEDKIQPSINRDTVLGSTGFFSNVFGAPCVPTADNNTSLRNAFVTTEKPLCDSVEKYIFPRRAQNVNGVWRYIVNTEQYEQGVTVSQCVRRAKGKSCKYGGERGIFPDATECRQLYTRHNMLAVRENGTVFVDSFKVPSTCICSLVDPDPFEE